MSLLVAGCRLMGPAAGRAYDVGACRDCDEGRCGPLCPIGCEHYSRCIDEGISSHEALRRANRSLRLCYDSRPSFDFRDGYRQAFVDVALGGRGQVPATPPERYWSTCYRTAAGHQRAQEWYAGYVAGTGRAMSLCRYQHNVVPTSGVPRLADESPTTPANWHPSSAAPSRWADELPPQ
ncbi:MAG: hypothetical protein KF861_14980 [Planctomycetaceae bacterium]|nr:hypothetical protein [Planctomycetaceae bacterium]